ncbi:MAG: tRNA (adenosine(37)-N6)-dimethylallyltransferase MiaA [Patescibacteria group bacterium]|nr:tRNA (adenosine(37)-N6)-dimethylallyltransferase MiaA [Patescibacteria group bacterium]
MSSLLKIPDTKYQIQNTNKILVILGPTSSGKSDIAIKLAKKFKGEIISADSRQIYRGMDVGTGKVPKSKVKSQKSKSQVEVQNYKNIYLSGGIPHYMIDIVSPRTDYNVAKFKKQAEKIIEDILQRGKLPIICGGTGFWISAIVDDVNFPEVKPDWKLRKKLENNSAEKLFAMLKKLDPNRAKNIDPKNKVRLIRAIEICKAIKHVPKIQNTPYKIPDTRYQILQIGLKLPKEKLHQNIEKRVKARFTQGMIKEVERLHNTGLSWKKIQSFGLAYFWIPLYLQKKLSFEELRTKVSKEKSLALGKKELVEKIIQAEKNYAKRQMTWFKQDKRIKWFSSYSQIEKSACNFFLK